jgi:predicted nucleic acid-binding protein
MPAPLRYWDSCTFLGWLAEEPDKVDDCQSVIRHAEAGNVRIVTSSLTLTEVIKLKGKPPLAAVAEPKIKAFFKHEWIVVVQLDRFIAEAARQLVWEHGLDPKDCVHVATALRTRVNRMDTFDEALIKRSGQIGNLVIGRPDMPQQLEMEFDAEVEETGDESATDVGTPESDL